MRHDAVDPGGGLPGHAVEEHLRLGPPSGGEQPPGDLCGGVHAGRVALRAGVEPAEHALDEAVRPVVPLRADQREQHVVVGDRGEFDVGCLRGDVQRLLEAGEALFYLATGPQTVPQHSQRVGLGDAGADRPRSLECGLCGRDGVLGTSLQEHHCGPGRESPGALSGLGGPYDQLVQPLGLPQRCLAVAAPAERDGQPSAQLRLRLDLAAGGLGQGGAQMGGLRR